MMFVFSKVSDRLISGSLLTVNSIIDTKEICLEFKINYLPDNLAVAASVSLRTFFAVPRGSV